MAAAMIVELSDTTTTAINKKLDELREKVGAVNLGRVLTLVIAPDSDALLEESIEAAIAAGHEHPSRVIVVMNGDAEAAEARLDAQLRVGSDSGAGERVVLRLSGPVARHPGSGGVAGQRPGRAGAGFVGPIGNPTYHRCNQRGRPILGDQKQT